MYFRFGCPQCGKKLKVRPEHAGRRVGCPYCKSTLVIPAPQEDEIDDIEEFVDESQRTDSGHPSIQARTGTSPRQRSDSEVTFGGSGNGSDGTNVSMMLSGLIGLAITAVFYLLMIPLAKTGFGELFVKSDSGWWVPPFLVFMMAWAGAILFLKWRKLARQRASMLFDLLPTELGSDITIRNLEGFAGQIRSLPVEASESFLVNRVIRGLEHFRVRKNAPEVASILTSQSDIDANSVESSYTLLKVFIWAIPILGFIGTVVGISAAVGGFSGTLDSADDISVLKDSLNNVTGGLATAFDTTLVALVMSMLVMFPTSSLQKAEEDLLNWVDEYCNENLLKRLDDGREGGAERGSSLQQAAIQQSVDRAMVGHHAEIKAWSKKLETIGSTLTDQVAAGWTSMQQDLQGQQQENLQRLQQIDSLADQFQANLTGLSENAEANGQQMAASLRDSAAAMSSYVSELQRGLQGLSEVLADLGQQQVIVQQQPRRGWFFRRRNGGK